MRKNDFDMPKPPRGHEWCITPGDTGGWVERGTPAVTITLRKRRTKQPVAWRGSEMSDEAILLAAQWLLWRVEQDKWFAEARRRDIDTKSGRWLGVWR